METRVAIVGLGKMGLMHASILQSINDVKVVAACDKSTMIRKFGKKIFPNMSIVENLEELYDMELNAIIITSPPASHFGIIKSTYEKKITQNIFTEKPLAINYPQAEEIVI